MVIRGPNGGGVQLSAQHTHSLEGFYGHFPGLKVVSPVTPHDAKGMMLTVDPRSRTRSSSSKPARSTAPRARCPRAMYTVPFGKARIAREGTDVTLVGYGRQVNHAVAGGRPAGQGRQISAEVIDLRSIRPFDEATIVESVRKTHRAVVVQEQWRWFSVASEVAAIIQEQAFDDLDAPVERVSGAEAPAPYARNLEMAAFPSEQQMSSTRSDRAPRIERR